MNIVIFTTWNVQDFIPAVNVELIENHLKKGDTIKVVVCNSELHSCFAHHLFQENKNQAPFKNKDTCLYCQMRWRSILNDKLKIDNKDIISLAPYPKNLSIPLFQSNEQLKEYSYKGIGIGNGILSTLISLFRDTDIDLNENRMALEAVYKNAISTILTFEDLLKEVRIDKVYIFNGRISERRAAVEFCKENEIDYDTWEVAQTEKHYYLTNQTLPHNPINNAKDSIRLFYEDENFEPQERIKMATDWYISKRYGNYEDTPNNIDYTTTMKENDLSSLKINSNKTNIAIFVSSEDEIASLGKDIWPFEYRQTESIERIVSHFVKKDKFHFYLRIHPNLRDLDNQETKRLKSITAPNLTVITADSPINSYALLDACDKIVCFGSTVGIEATYWNKISILFGTSFYEHIPNSVYVPSSIDELMELIEDTTLTPKSKEAALVYSYGILNRGHLIKNIDVYNQKVEEIYKNKGLIYSFYKIYKKSPLIYQVIQSLKIHKLSKQVINYFSKI